MKILNYIIPEDHQQNDFVQSLFEQFTKKGKLTEKQEFALRNCIEIEDDFLEDDVDVDLSSNLYEDFKLLKTKLHRNRFRYTATKNRCIKALQSIIHNKPDSYLIDKVLHYNQNNWR